MFEIQSNHKIPTPFTRYPFGGMKIGDSFLASDNLPDARRVTTASIKYGKSHGMKFVTRKTPEGWRCWRTV